MAQITFDSIETIQTICQTEKLDPGASGTILRDSVESVRRRFELRMALDRPDQGFWRDVVTPVAEAVGAEKGFDLELRLIAISSIMARWS